MGQEKQARVGAKEERGSQRGGQVCQMLLKSRELRIET